MHWERDRTRIGYRFATCGYQADVAGRHPSADHPLVFRQRIRGLDVSYEFSHDFHQGWVEPGAIEAPHCLHCDAPVAYGRSPCAGHEERLDLWHDTMTNQDYVIARCKHCGLEVRPRVQVTSAIWQDFYTRLSLGRW